MKKQFNGIYSAIFSVYDENMDVKKDTISQIVEYHLASGLKGFYVCGATGECTVLPEKTRKQMLEAVVEANKGRGQIIAHVGAGHLDETLRLVEHANTLDIDAIASLPPSLTSYYNTNDTLRYYRKLASVSRHPVIAYITPVLNGNPVDFAKELIKIDNVAGIKLTIHDYWQFGDITSLNDGNVNVLNGPDETMICGLAVGADGAIGSFYNVCPKTAVKIYDAMQRNDVATARAYQRKLNQVIKIGLEYPIYVWKEFLSLKGFDMGYSVFPAEPVSQQTRDELRAKLTNTCFFEEE